MTAASSQGAIALRNNSTVRTALGGGISIRGGSLLLENSSMVADTDVVPGGSVDIDVTGRYESVRSQIDVSTEGASPAGSVNIRADEVILRGQSIAGGLTTAISAETTGAGNGGDVTIDARTIDVSDHANIAASANDAGNGGNVLLRATERVTLDGSTGPQPLTGIISETVGVPSDPTAAGKAGDIIITAPRVEMLRNAQITVRTKSFGAAGNVVINCDTLLIDGTGTGSTSFTGIEARVGDDFGSDPGGEGLGAPGPGGVVEINATDSVVLRKGGVITASTFGLGDGGGMQINAARLFLRGSTQHEFTGLFARTTHANQGGRGGDIRLDVGAIEITNRATISASSDLAAGDAGGIVINVSGPLVLRHGGAINVSSDLVNGGNIDINSSGMISLNDRARVAASAQENGGNIRIIARTIALSDSTITGQAGRSGGVITIDAGAVSLGDRSTINGIASLEDVRSRYRWRTAPGDRQFDPVGQYEFRSRHRPCFEPRAIRYRREKCIRAIAELLRDPRRTHEQLRPCRPRWTDTRSGPRRAGTLAHGLAAGAAFAGSRVMPPAPVTLKLLTSPNARTSQLS